MFATKQGRSEDTKTPPIEISRSMMSLLSGLPDAFGSVFHDRWLQVESMPNDGKTGQTGCDVIGGCRIRINASQCAPGRIVAFLGSAFSSQQVRRAWVLP